MTSRRHLADRSLHPLWMRWMAAFCIAMAAIVGSAQAVHTHGAWLPHSSHTVEQAAVSPTDGGEEHCPLCVALHSTMPVLEQLSLGPVVVVTSVVLLPAEHLPAAVPHFALFSRPPPAAPKA